MKSMDTTLENQNKILRSKFRSLVEALKPFADVAEFIEKTQPMLSTNPSLGLWVPSVSTGKKPPSILVSHVLVAKRVLESLDIKKLMN